MVLIDLTLVEHLMLQNLKSLTLDKIHLMFYHKQSEDYVGILTTKVGIEAQVEGLFFYSKGSTSGIASGLYYFSSNHEQVIGDIDKVTTTVLTNVSAANTTTHNLQEGDVIKMNVIPKLSASIGTTTPISVRSYNSEYEKTIINPITFSASDVETNRIDISDHGFKTGDKIFYNGGNRIINW